jgi:HSP20 family molecular chaperone IbpA
LTDILSIPIYTNSLARQSDAQLEQMQVSAPRYDIQELAEGYELTMEVPGVSADNLMVEVEDESLLRVSGTREHHGAGRVAVETKFDQTFSLDNVDTSEIKVTLSNGILRITAPKKEKVLKRLLIEQNEAKAAELPVKAVGDKALEESASETEQPPDETIDGLTMSPEQNIDQ